MIFSLSLLLIAVIVIAVVAGVKDQKSHSIMKLTSSAFADGAAIPAVFSCEGEGTLPPLAFSDVPDGTESLALIVEDPDAVRGTFVHGVLYDIKPADSRVNGHYQFGLNTAGEAAYTPPCPPSGTHRYVFTLYALDTGFQSPPAGTVDANGLRSAMQGHVISYTNLTGTYQQLQ